MVYLQRPAVLFGLAAVPPLALLWRRACRGAAEVVEAVGGDASRRANSARGGIRLAALCALLVGLAGPVVGGPGGMSPAAAPVVFVLDLSRSMAATDLEPDRLAQARLAGRALCDLLPQSRTALITAAQDAVMVCPPTHDRPSFLSLLERTRTDWLGGGGTQLAPALELAGEVIERDGGPGVVVLLSDGEDHGPDPTAEVRRMREAGTLTHTVVIGSSEGVALRGVFLDGPVMTAARPQPMAEWAEAGGGRAWSIGPDGARLPDSPNSVVPRRTARAAARRSGAARDVSSVFYLVAALLLAGDVLAPLAGLARTSA
jgi:hypothetical protein